MLSTMSFMRRSLSSSLKRKSLIDVSKKLLLEQENSAAKSILMGIIKENPLDKSARFLYAKAVTAMEEDKPNLRLSPDKPTPSVG